jgi:hypothetical protein
LEPDELAGEGTHADAAASRVSRSSRRARARPFSSWFTS